MTGIDNPLILGPIVVPLIGAAICLILSQHNRAQRVVALIAGLIACLCSIGVLIANIQGGENAVQVYRVGGYPVPFGVVLVADMMAALFAVMGSSVVALGLLYCLQCRDHSLTYPVFMPAFLGVGAGLAGSFYTGDVFTFFVFLELMVMSSVVMVAVSDNRLGLEAAIKYIFISGIGSMLLLLGIAAIYTTFGTLTLAQVAQALATGERPLLALPAAVMFLIAFLIKSAVVPFHFWQPDFHTTAPTPVSGLLSSVVVKVGIYGIIRSNTLFFTQEAPFIQNILIVLGLIGIFFGGLSALRTWNAKRMLAYSTLGQVGFMLVAIGWGSPISLVAAIIYIVNHAYIKSGMLMLTGALASRVHGHSSDIKDLEGAGRGFTLLSILYLIGGLALAGVPPFNGFISKLALVRGGVDRESWVILGLVIAGGILTLIYMTRTWQWIFQRPPRPHDHAVNEEEDYQKGPDSPLAPALLLAFCVALGVFATPLINLAEATAAQITQPVIYRCAVLPPELLPAEVIDACPSVPSVALAP
jgi:multicomponent Na+:H+ antiporter subunit D